MNSIDPKQIKIVKGLPPVAKKGDKIAIDSEFFGQEKKRLHRPHGTLAFLGCTFDGKTVYYITEPDEVQEFFDRLDAGVWIFHNAKYDLRQLRKFAKIPQRKLLWDTMLIEQIMWSGYYSEFSLADLARRRLDLYLPKDVRSEFAEATEMTQDQINYSAADVVATWLVYKDQRATIDENDLDIWKNIELPFLWVILSMGGIKLDVKAWSKLAKKNKETADNIQKKYEINLNSPKQVKEYLLSCGHKVTSTDAEALEKIASIDDEDDAGVRFANDMMVYRTYAKRASTYGEKFIEEYVEEDGRIYGDIFQIGAETSRTSSRNPNLQNQPHEKEYRECFIADKGNCMIVADYGSQEPRIAAYLSQDQGLIDILNSDKKLYTEIARDALGLNITKKSPEYSHIKSTILGIFYGMSAYGLAKQIGVSEDEAQNMIDKILTAYPGIREYIERQHNAGEYVETLYGRKIWLNKYVKGWERGALNYPIQGSAAEALKLASRRFLDNWCDGEFTVQSPLRLLVHDEIVLEIEKEQVDNVTATLERAMLSVAEEMHEGIKGVAEISSGSSWASKA